MATDSLAVTLCGTQITGNMIKEELKADLGSVIENLLSVSGKILDDKNGHTSYILKATLTWSENTQDEDVPKLLMIKVTTNAKIAEVLEMFEVDESPEGLDAQKMFVREKNAYKVFCKGFPEYPVPRLYNVSSGESSSVKMIMLEDLSNTVTVQHLKDGMTTEQLFSCAEVVAKLQAWSLTTTFPWNNFVDSEESMLKMCDSFFHRVSASIDKTNERYPTLLANKSREKIQALLTSDNFYKVISGYRDILPAVWVHGDFWIGNILFAVNDETKKASSKIAAIIDWQLTHSGSFAEDLIRLFSFCVESDVRESCMKRVIHHYWKLMSALVPNYFGSITFEVLYRYFEQQLAITELWTVAMIGFFMDIFLNDFPDLEDVFFARIKACLDHACCILDLG